MPNFRFSSPFSRLICLSLSGLMSAISTLTWAANDSVSETDLLEQFALQTDLARENQLNAEYLAGGSQVLYGETLRRKGLQTVGEALSRLPGVQQVITNTGTAMTVRGNIVDILQSDLQMRLNGVDLVAVNEFQPYFVFNLPLDVVERIEVTKGPGSARFGEYSQNGVINVVTIGQQAETLVTGGGGAKGTHHFGLNRQWTGSDWLLDLSLSTRRRDGDEGFIEEDALYTATPPQAQASKAPGNADNRSHFDGAILRFEWGNTRLDASYLSALEGDGWGPLGWLANDDRYKRENQVSSIQIEQDLDVSGQNVTLQAGLQRYDFIWNTMGFTEGFIVPIAQPPFFQVLDRELYQDNYAVIQRSYASVRWQNNELENHDLLAELRYQFLDVRDAGSFVNFDTEQFLLGNLVPLDQPSSTRGLPFSTWVFNDVNEHVWTLALEDKVQLTDDFRSVFGFRYDSRQDTCSPRLALLYELEENQRISMQVAHASRTPTLNQEAVNPNLDKESSLLFDMAYRYETEHIGGSITAYVSRVKNKISPERIFDDSISFVDFVRARAVNDPEDRTYKGIETRFDYRHSAFELELALSYMNGDGTELQRSENFVSPWSADLGFTYYVNDWLNAYLEQRFLSERERVSGDSRDDFSSQSETNLTLAISPLSSDELLVTLNVRNLFNRDSRAPSGWLRADDFPEDFPIGGREIHASVAFRW